MVAWSTQASKTLKEHCIFMNRYVPLLYWLLNVCTDWHACDVIPKQTWISFSSVTVIFWCYLNVLYALNELCLCLIVSHQAITTPAMAVSHIMLEAYKKYILVSLILHGKVQQLPKYTSQIVGRFIKVRINCIGRINSVWTIFFCFFGTAVTQQSKICCLFKQKTSLSVFTCGRAETLAALCTVYIFSCLQNMPEFSTKYWVHLPIPITCIRSKSYF